MILDFKKLNKNISKILDTEKVDIMKARNFCNEIVNKNTTLTEDIKKELNENYGFDFKIGNFLKQIFIRVGTNGLECHEILTYEKKVSGGGIEIQFISNKNETDISTLLIEAGKDKTGFYVELLNHNNFFIKSMVLHKKNMNKSIYLIRNNENNEMYLNLIKNEDLTNIDNKEYEDLFSLIFDYKLNLKEHEAFGVFKEEFDFFLNYINIESKNKLKSKI